MSEVPDTSSVRTIHPARRPLDVTVRVPGSKSITNRALLLAALLVWVRRTDWWAFRHYVETSLPFFSGIGGAYLVRVPGARALLSRGVWSGPLAAALVAAILLLPDAPLGALVLMTLVFMTVAGGNSWYGLLTSRWTILLGHLSYSVYLIHGLVLLQLRG